jgi:hypothetical protein
LKIGDVERETGFPLVLPSYLPQEMSKSLIVSSGDYNIGTDQYVQASVQLLPGRREGLWIYIDERTRNPGTLQRGYPPSSQLVKIGQTDVACWVEVAQLLGLPTPPLPQPTEDPERYPRLNCGWETDELYFDVDFAWQLPEPVPGLITPEMREEAMKVIASMIEDPYVP